MGLTWQRENPARWDVDKARVVGAEPYGTFGETDYAGLAEGTVLPGDWFRVDRGGRPVAYGWMDTVWGDAEILLAVDASERAHGLGTYVLEHLEREAESRGLNYLFNQVSPRHPRAEAVSGWLRRQGFQASEDGRALRRKVVRGA